MKIVNRNTLNCILGLLCTWLFAINASARVLPVASNRIVTSAILAQNPVAVTFSGHPTAIQSGLNSGAFVHRQVLNRVILGIDQSATAYQGNPYMVELDLMIYYDIVRPNLSVLQCSTSACMFVEYRPDGMYTDKNVFEFIGGTQCSVAIQSPPIVHSPVGSLVMNLYLDVEVEVERDYKFDASANIPVFTTPATTYHSTDGELEITWNAADWAEEFELEWTYVDDYNVSSPSAIAYSEDLFRFNSTRITTTANSYRIPLVYGKGYLLYRLRGLGKLIDYTYQGLFPGPWTSSACSSCITVAAFTDKFQLTSTHAHEDKLNWQFSAAYAEEGKSKLTVSYFDGSLRNRQTVTKAKTDNTTIVGETIYDHQGRPAINVLPVPAYQQKIQYHRLFNLNYRAKPYNKSNFDLDHLTEACKANPDSMITSSGAAAYYSFLHLNSGTHGRMDNFLPDAKGYPFTQNQYTPDNTGRLRAQSGVGKNLRLGTGLETKYYYGKPFQEELDQLFGYEAGNALHYKKNLVIDPNGQVSISYLDPAGKVVATTLAGGKPDNVQALSSYVSNNPFSTFDLLNKTRSTDSTGSENIIDLASGTRKLSRELLIDKDGVRHFGYYLSGNKFSAPCPSDQTPICYQCVLDLEISLKDECGNELLGGIDGASGTSTILGSSILQSIQANKENMENAFNPRVDCSNETVPPLSISKGLSGSPKAIDQSWATSASLKAGSYSLNKILKVNKTALDFYTNNYFSDSNCFTPLSVFVNEELAKIDFEGCSTMTCASCSTAVGPRSNYANAANDNTDCGDYPCLTDEQYDVLLAQCAELCNNSTCDAMLTAMKGDMSPGGQYAGIYANGVQDGVIDRGVEGDINPYVHPLSIFNEANQLPLRKIRGVVRIPSWRFPYNGAYHDENGQLSYVIVKRNEVSGKIEPAILPTAQKKLIPLAEEGTYKIAPQYLLRIRDFLQYWKQSWVKELLPYHPEYGYYQYCQKLQQQGSHSYDDDLINNSDYSDAVSNLGLAKMLLPLGPAYANPVPPNAPLCNPVNNAALAQDPLFNNTSNPLFVQDEYLAMQNALCKYTILPLPNLPADMSIWELAYKIAYCPKAILPAASSACSTCTMPFTTTVISGTIYQVPDFSGPQEDKAWQIFRMLYISLKQRMVEFKTAKEVILQSNSYGGCIGNPNFDINTFGFATPGNYSPSGSAWMFSAPWNFPNYLSAPGSPTHSQFFNFEQPCNWSRYHLYTNKQPRYYSSSRAYDMVAMLRDINNDPHGGKYTNSASAQVPDGLRMSGEVAEELIKKNESLVDLSIYQRCEKCPMAQDLELLLNAMLQNKSCPQPNPTTPDLINATGCNILNMVPIGCNNPGNTYAELTDELETLIGQASGSGKLSWKLDQLTYNTGSQYWHLQGTFWLAGGTSPVCSLELRTPNGTPNADGFNAMSSFCCLKYLPNPQYLSFVNNRNFQITAIIPDATVPAGYREMVLEGFSSCVNVAACELKPICSPSPEAVDLLTMFNTLLNFKNPACTSSSCGNALVQVASGFKLTDDAYPFASGFSSLLRYKTDSKIYGSGQEAITDPTEDWYWETVYNSSNHLNGKISGQTPTPAPTNIEECYFNLELPTGYTFSQLKKLSNLRPDPDALHGGFLADALLDLGGGVLQYVPLKGLAPCFNMGDCSTDPAAALRMASPAAKQVTCTLNQTGKDLLDFLNAKDAAAIRDNDGKITQPIVVYQCDGGVTCTALGGPPETVYQTHFDTYVKPYFIILKQLENHYNPGTASCHEDLRRYKFYNYTSQTLFGCIAPGDTISFMWGPCCNVSFHVFYNMNSGKCDLVEYNAYCRELDAFGNVIHLSKWTREMPCQACPGTGGGSPTSSTGTCPITFERLPAGSGYTFQDVVGVVELLPDPDRPSEGGGYFIARLKMKDGGVLEVKGYSGCGPIGSCKPCDRSNMLANGDFAEHTALSPGIDYTYNAGSMACPNDAEYILSTSSNCNSSNSSDIISDHTLNSNMFPGVSSSGHFLFLGASASTGDKLAWKKSISVVPGKEYSFRLYYLNANAASNTDPNNYLRVELNGKNMMRKQVKYLADASGIRQWQELSFIWLADDNTLDIEVFNEVKHGNNLLALDDIYIGTNCGCTNDNLISNGDFSLNHEPEIIDYNNVTPSLQLRYTSPPPPLQAPPAASKDYNLFRNYPVGAGSPDLFDHQRPGRGRFMAFLLASGNTPATSAVAWRQIVDVEPGSNYIFSSWFSAELQGIMDVEMYVNNQLLTRAGNDNIVAPKWFTLSGQWYSGQANKAELLIIVSNKNTTPSVNNFFALDDVQLRKNCFSSCKPSYVAQVEFQTPDDNCVENLSNIAVHNARIRYEQYRQELEENFREEYVKHCLQVYEDFLFRNQDNGQHFTLYYYDQAGNLVRTIPPAGVTKITDDAALRQVRIDRYIGKRTVFSQHSMSTTYAYNSLNQLQTQSMPDHNDMRIWDVFYRGRSRSGLNGWKASSFYNPYSGIVVGSILQGTNMGALAYTDNAGKNWTDIDKVQTGEPLALEVIDLTHAVMISTDHKVLYSADAGVNWVLKNTLPASEAPVGLHFWTPNDGWLLNKNGSVYQTANAGDTWTITSASIPLASGDAVKTQYTWSGNSIAITEKGQIFKSANGWATTSNAVGIRSVGLSKIQFVDANNGFASGRDGTLLKSSDAGQTWSEVANNLHLVNLKDLHFRSHTAGIALDNNGRLYRSKDQGKNWDPVEFLAENEELSSLDFSNKNAGMAITREGRLLGTLDGGQNWADLVSVSPALGNGAYIKALSMLSNTEAFAAGEDGKLWYIRFVMDQWYILSCSACSLGLSPSGTYPVKMHFSDRSQGCLISNDGKLYTISTNLPASPDDVPPLSYTVSTALVSLSPAPAGTFTDLQFISATEGYVLSNKGEYSRSTDGGQTWGTTDATNYNSGYQLNSLFVQDAATDILFTVGDNGQVNKGLVAGTWTDYSATVTVPPLNKLYMMNGSSTPYIAYACGEDGTLLQSDDGSNWKAMETGSSGRLNDVVFKDANNGLLVGDGAYVATTKNGGVSWGKLDMSSIGVAASEADYHSAILRPGSGSSYEYYVGGTDGLLLHYISSPVSWAAVSSAVSNDITLLYNFNSGSSNLSVLAGRQTEIAANSSGTWAAASSLRPAILNDIQVLEDGTGYAVGNAGNLLKTTDAGKHWQSLEAPTTQNLNALHFISDKKGYIVGDNGAIYSTRNGGLSWASHSQPSGSTYALYDVYIVSENFALLGGAGNKLFFSVNPFGTSPSWTTYSTSVIGSSGNIIRAIHAPDEKQGFVVGDGDLMLKYTYNENTHAFTWTALQNGSTPWVQHHSGTANVNVNDVQFRDHLTGYVVAANGLLLKTTDGGSTWSKEQNDNPAGSGNSTNYLDLNMVDDHHLFLAGYSNDSKNLLYVYDQKDEFSTRFYYDKLGRLTVSQNARQYAISPLRYSYTLYDFKGRISEVGEIQASTPIEEQYTDAGIRLNEDDYKNWLTAGTRTEVTRTFYDKSEADYSGSPVTMKPSVTYYSQVAAPTYGNTIAANSYTSTFDNLRGRVAAITYAASRDNDPRKYDYAIYYSYDAHGNVKSIVNEANIPLQDAGNTIRHVLKQVDYDYDLVSGKVNKVIFEPGKKERFYHRYEYDADNRITSVHTSHDGVIWQNDARYQYYKHGPLARTELGHDNVQGLDYAYTMQGWLKAVNSNTLVKPERDMGRDGYRPSSGTNPNSHFAPDEFGFSLQYFKGDYEAINSPVAADHFLADIPSSSNLYTNSSDLYNGNISSMITAIRQFMIGGAADQKPQAMVYSYDQLNRLAKTRKLQNIDLPNNQWQNSTGLDNNYEEEYQYDANGNITHLKRNGINNCNGKNEIDDLVYKYEHSSYSASYSRKSNRLRAVIDQVQLASAQGSNDIQPGQSWLPAHSPAGDNYQYDETGNLIKDLQEEVALIEWTTYGKIKKITRTTGSKKPDLEFAYDPSGNRVLKIVKPRNGSGLLGQDYWKYTYYSRDAQGNTLANFRHYGSNAYSTESYLLYGSSRLGEYQPGKYEQGCGVKLNMSNWTAWTDAGNWAESYVKSLGYDAAIATEWKNKWNGISTTFSSVDSKALHYYMNFWMEWLCRNRCYREAIGSSTTVFSSYWNSFWSSRISELEATGGWKNYETHYFSNLRNNTWPAALETLHSSMSGYTCESCRYHTYAKGSRHYELSNHLGNVLVTLSDRKIAVDEEYTYTASGTTQYQRAYGRYTLASNGGYTQTASADGTSSEYLAELITAQDYYPFGMIMPGRSYSQEQLLSSKKTQCLPCSHYSSLISSFSGTWTNNSDIETHFNQGLSEPRTAAQHLQALRHCGLLEEKATLNGNGYIDFGHQANAALGAGNFTLEGWIRMDNTAKTYRTMASNLTDIGGGILQGYDFFVHQNKKLVLWMSYKTGGSYNLFLQVLTQNISNLDDNTWHHVAAVRTGSSVNDITLYVDGTPYTMANGGLTLNADNLGPYPNFDTDLANTARTWLGAISVGSNYTSPADHFLGDMKQFRIYKRALSGTEISANFVNTCNYEPMDASMMVFYAPLNEGTTSVAPKDVLNNLSGTHSGTGNSMSRTGLSTSTCTTTACEHCISTEYLELAGAYRFGFNGKERDDEMYNEGNSYDFGARMYMSRIGKWFKVDPDAGNYVPVSTYAFALNNPMRFIDVDGKKIYDGQKEVIVTIDSKTQTATYTHADGSPVSEDFMKNGKKIIDAMIKTPTGRQAVENLIKLETEVHLQLTEKEINGAEAQTDVLDENGEVVHPSEQYQRKYRNDKGEYNAVRITISTASSKETDNSKNRYANTSEEELINSVGTHEEVHTRVRQINKERADGTEEAHSPCFQPELTTRFEYKLLNPDKGKDPEAYKNSYLKYMTRLDIKGAEKDAKKNVEKQ